MPNDPNTPFKLNLPTELKELLSEKAKQQHRSLTGEMIYRLEQSCEFDLGEARKQAELLRDYTNGDLGIVRDRILRICKILGVED